MFKTAESYRSWVYHLLLGFTFLGTILAFQECHDDPTFEPSNGLLQYLQFTWLGTLQYIHVKTGNPHYFRVPRVVLVSRQFVLATATDASHIPDGYALGNVIFGDYERDEEDCNLTSEQVAAGAHCEPAMLLMPIADVLLHPEYKHFGIKNSIALLKLYTLIKSKYMVPVCLPFKDFVNNVKPEKYYHIDFLSDIPRDFREEDKETTYIKMLPNVMCPYYDGSQAGNATDIRQACSDGCGYHSGAPTLVHEHTGHWTVISLAQGGAACPDPLRPQRSVPTPMHTLLHPYLNWISTAIAGRSASDMAKFDPFGYIMPRASVPNKRRGWVGKWWMGGIRCYDRGEQADELFRFYHEVFLVVPRDPSTITYFIEIDAPSRVSIVCIKIGVPHRLGTPTLWGLEDSSVKIRLQLTHFHAAYSFEVEAFGRNT